MLCYRMHSSGSGEEKIRDSCQKSRETSCPPPPPQKMENTEYLNSILFSRKTGAPYPG